MDIVSYLSELKQKIQSCLNDINDKLVVKGQPEANDFSEVPALIEAIQSGSSGSGPSGIDTTISTNAASASDILSGKKAYVNGSLITGNIPSLASKSYTPGTSNQTISSGRYLSGTQTILGDANLVSDNIRSGVNIFGVNGSYTASNNENGVGIDTSDATATSDDIRSGKTAYINGVKISGNIVERTASDVTINETSIDIPAGIYDGTVSKSIPTVDLATPEISVNSNGTITVTMNQSIGYVTENIKTATVTLSSNHDSDFIESNIRKGTTIFGKTGTYDSSEIASDIQTLINNIDSVVGG